MVVLVGASCESRLLDYRNQRSRFMFSFGDGAVAALLAWLERRRAGLHPRSSPTKLACTHA
ncbi:MAG: hypothetical protein ACYCO9_16780 [Streptosporangiaceae bacterium]